MTPTDFFRESAIGSGLESDLLGGSRCRSNRWRRKSALYLGPLTKVLHDTLENLTTLLSLEELNDLGLGLIKSGRTSGLLVSYLDDVIAELGLHWGGADAADLLGEGGISKLGHHLVFGEVT